MANLNSQTFATLGATALEDDTAVLRLHANTEAMGLGAAAPIGLVSALHKKQPSIVNDAKSCQRRKLW